MSIRLGLDCALYYNVAGYATPSFTEITNCRDVTLNLEKNEADVTTRGSNGWRAMVGVLKDGSVDFQMVWDTADTAFTALKDAYFNNTSIDIAVMDGPIDDAESEGLRAEMSVINFTRNEPLEEAATVDVTIRPTYSANPPEWISGDAAYL